MTDFISELLALKFINTEPELTDEQYVQEYVDAFKERTEEGLIPASQAKVHESNEHSIAAMALPHRLPLR